MAEQGTVLVVDDNRGMLLTLRRILAAEGYRVLIAENGGAAIEVAGRESLDFALIDYRMTGLNGGEACARVSALQPQAAVYMMTAHVSPERRNRHPVQTSGCPRPPAVARQAAGRSRCSSQPVRR
jgi:CheY-like chemotaxis protein